MAKCAIIKRAIFCAMLFLFTANAKAEDLKPEEDLHVLGLNHQKLIDPTINPNDDENNDGDYDYDESINNGNEIEATVTEVPEIQFQPKVISRAINITINSEEYTNISSDNFPDPYPPAGARYEWVVGFGSGFGVEMIVKTIDFAQDDYLLIRPGGIESSERQIIFSWYLKTQRKFKLLHLDEMFIAFVVKAKGSNLKKGFNIDFKRLGEIMTTTTPEPTEEPPVTVAPLKEAVFYLGGMTPLSFLNISETFKMELASIAEKYCDIYNIKTDNVTFFDNVNYHVITRCNIDWPDSIRCIEIRYSIAVYFDNVTGNYEMTAAHLDDMWLKYGNSLNLTTMGLTIYVPPNDEVIMVIWFAVCGGLLFTFLIILYFIWRCRFFYEGSFTRRDSVASQKKSDVSLFPTPHQSVPPMYALDSLTPESDRFWSGDEYLPPKYSHDGQKQHLGDGQQNYGYVGDVEFFDLYSEEIIMSLPDNCARKSKDVDNESNL